MRLTAVVMAALVLLAGSYASSAVKSPNAKETGALQEGPVTKAARTPGKYVTKNGKFHAALIHSEGDREDLMVFDAHGNQISPRIDDVTGIVWIDNATLAFSTSPIYGCLVGVFVFDCDKRAVRQLVSSVKYTRSSPQGASFFQLVELDRSKGLSLRYFFVEDLNATGKVVEDSKSMRSVEIQ